MWTPEQATNLNPQNLPAGQMSSIPFNQQLMMALQRYRMPGVAMPLTGAQTPNVGAGAPTAGAGYDPNDPFGAGSNPTNPWTGAAFPGGGGGATGGINKWMQWDPYFAGAGGILGQMFGGRNPYGAAEGEMGQIPGMLEKYFGPYLQAGQWALPQLYSQYGALLADPGAKMAQFGSEFQQSPGYEWQKQQALQAGQQAAAAGGMAGTPAEQQQQEQTATQLANQDYYNYLNHVMNLYQQGLGGTAGLGQLGFRAASGLGEDLASIMQAQAQLAAAQQQYGAEQGGGFGAMIGAALPYIAGAL